MESSIEYEIFNNYQHRMDCGIRFFCPSCFRTFSERTILKHFAWCSDLLVGRVFFRDDSIVISKISDDPLFRQFLNRFNKFLYGYTQEIRPLRYSKYFDYWIFQDKTLQFGTLLVGLGYVRYNWDIGKYVLSALVIFPSSNLNKGIGTRFISQINGAYTDFGGLVLESPNEVSKHIADKLGLKYYSVFT